MASRKSKGKRRTGKVFYDSGRSIGSNIYVVLQLYIYKCTYLLHTCDTFLTQSSEFDLLKFSAEMKE